MFFFPSWASKALKSESVLAAHTQIVLLALLIALLAAQKLKPHPHYLSLG